MTDTREERTRELYFLIKYDWTTKATSFCRYDDEVKGPEMFKDVGPDETIHRCTVRFSQIPADYAIPGHDGLPVVRAREMYNETDLLDWRRITAFDAISRINVCRVFPVIPAEVEPGKTLSIDSTYETALLPDGQLNTEHAKLKKQSELVRFGGRRFRITVEELGDE